MLQGDSSPLLLHCMIPQVLGLFPRGQGQQGPNGGVKLWDGFAAEN